MPGRPAGVWSRLGAACAQVVGRRCVVNTGRVAATTASVCVIDQRRHGRARWEVMAADPERVAIDHVAQRLSRQFTDLDTDLVARVVWDTYRHFDTHPTRDVVPVLVQDAARDRLLVMPTPGRSAPRGGSRRGR